MPTQKNKNSILGGTMIVAGTSIGAGMLALPTQSAGMWLGWAGGLLVLTWLCMLFSSQAILEVNLHYTPGSSFHSLVKDLLGTKWSVINGISIAFVLYILVYAYISGGSSMVTYLSEATLKFTPNKKLASLLFAIILMTCVWCSTWLVDKISIVLMILMIISFFISMSGMIPAIRLSNIFDTNGLNDGRFIYIWAAVSTYLTSFCFHGSVPSLVKYYGKDPIKIHQCLIYGTIITLFCYVIWIFVASGAISRIGFKAIIAVGGNVGDLIQATNSTIPSILINRMLDIFASLAIVTSFLGAGLGLFDYIADLCKFSDSRLGRTKTMLITFIPSLIGGIFFPNGFIPAIAWAGLFSVIWAVITPALMVLASRKKYSSSNYTPFKGKFVPYFLISYGIMSGICHILIVFHILPMFR